MASMFEGLELLGGADFHVHLRDGPMMETVKLHQNSTKSLVKRFQCSIVCRWFRLSGRGASIWSMLWSAEVASYTTVMNIDSD